MPCTAGGTPVTIDTLFGFVKLGTHALAEAKRPGRTFFSREGATPAWIAWLM